MKSKIIQRAAQVVGYFSKEKKTEQAKIKENWHGFKHYFFSFKLGKKTVTFAKAKALPYAYGSLIQITELFDPTKYLAQYSESENSIYFPDIDLLMELMRMHGDNKVSIEMFLELPLLEKEISARWISIDSISFREE